MDPISGGGYRVVYLHDEDIEVGLDWLKRLYEMWAAR